MKILETTKKLAKGAFLGVLLASVLINASVFLSVDADSIPLDLNIQETSTLFPIGVFTNFNHIPKHMVIYEPKSEDEGGSYLSGMDFIRVSSGTTDENIINHEIIHYNVDRLEFTDIISAKRDIGRIIPIIDKKCKESNQTELDRNVYYKNPRKTEDDKFLYGVCELHQNLQSNPAYAPQRTLSPIMNNFARVRTMLIESEYLAYTTDFLIKPIDNGNGTMKGTIKEFKLKDSENVEIYEVLSKYVSKILKQ